MMRQIRFYLHTHITYCWVQLCSDESDFVSNIVVFKIHFWCDPFGCLYFSSFSIAELNWLGHFNWPGMALIPFPSSVGWDKIRTHDLSIMTIVCYSLDQAYASQILQLKCESLPWTYTEQSMVNFLSHFCALFNWFVGSWASVKNLLKPKTTPS